MVSDAGTPAVSDPGAIAVAAVRAAGFEVIPIPGASAAITALSAAGLEDARFLFVGFLPAKSSARRKQLEALRQIPAALVFYEAPHRIMETVEDLAATYTDQRELVVARELTKLHESITRGPLSDAPAWMAADANRQRGEFVLIVTAPVADAEAPADGLPVLKILLRELPLKQAVKLAAEITGLPKNALYDQALALKAGENGDGDGNGTGQNGPSV